MAIASYFSKNALAIQHVLKKGSYEEFVALLNQQVVEIAFDESVRNPEGKACLDLLIKLIARLYPRIKLSDLAGTMDDVVQHVKKTAGKINSKIEFTDTPATVCVCLGNTPVSKDVLKIFYIGSDHWTVRLSDTRPLGFGESALPFAAGISACIGAANVFRFVFFSLLRKPELDQAVSFSLLAPHGLSYANIATSDLGSFSIVGMGAIGSGCLWALKHLQGVTGKVHVIDHQRITASNLQRYVQALQAEKGRVKVDMAKQVLKGTAIEVVPFHCTWNEYIAGQGHYREEVVLTCLDSREDRMAVQASLPKLILNGYTDDGILGISRHMNFLHQACINCMYLPKEERPSTSEVIAKDLGIPERSIRDLLYLNAKVDGSLLRQIAEANHISYEAISRFQGTLISDFYSEFICAGTLLEIKKSSGAEGRTVEAPLAFQSALAGILLVAELYLFRSDALYQPRFNRTHYNPLAPIKEGINFIHHTLHKDAAGRCICTDEVYRGVYGAKWNC